MNCLKNVAWFIIFVTALMTNGCWGSVGTTEDSVRVEGEVPKIEVGNQPIDLDPSTDDDLDIDTPAPGDN